MTEKITGEHGIISEDRTEEILNQTFFRDFTFRSPRKTAYHYYIPNIGRSREYIFLWLGGYTHDKKKPRTSRAFFVC